MLIACMISLSSVLTACLSKVILSLMFSLSPHQYITIRVLSSQSVSTEYCLNCVVYSAAECCCLMCWIIHIATLSSLACNDSNLHVVQAGNLGAVDGGRLPRLLVVAAPRANQVTGRAAGVAE